MTTSARPSPSQLKGGMMTQDIFVEVGHGPTLMDNNILLSDASPAHRDAGRGYGAQPDLRRVHLRGQADTAVPRYTPYHIPHRTEVMGFMTILHGDDRFYNNIFVQKWPSDPLVIRHDSDDGTDEENRAVGTHVWDEYPTYDEWIARFDMDTDTPDMAKLAPAHEDHLPVWCKGNVYFNGAKAWKKEENPLVDSEHQVEVELVEQDGKPVLKTNVYEFLKGVYRLPW